MEEINFTTTVQLRHITTFKLTDKKTVNASPLI